MRWLFRWLFRLLILLVVLLVAALLLLDTIIREVVENRIQHETGLETRIGKMRVGLLDPRVTIENLVIYNRADFGGGTLLEVPEIHIECDRNPLFNGNYHFKLIRLNLAQLNVVEDANGHRNLDLLGHKSSAPPTNPQAKKPRPETFSFPQIDTLNLSLGRATYMSMKEPGKVSELPINVRNQVYTNIRSSADLENDLLLLLLGKYNFMGVEGQKWLEWLGLVNAKASAKAPVNHP